MKPLAAKALRILVGLAVIGVVAGGAFLFGPALLGHSKAAKDEGPRAVAEVPVTVAAVTARPVERRVGLVGTLEGFEEVNISPKVEGRVLRVYRDMGDTVAPGDVLADIDPVDLQLALAEAERGLELELAKLGLTELVARDKLDLGKVPTVMRARNMEDNARAMLERARKLGTGRVIGVEELEKIQTEARVAASNRVQAELDARATLASARLKHAQVESAKQRVLDARVVVPAPSPGRLPPGVKADQVRYVVASRKAAEGEVFRVFPSSTIFRLVIDRPLKLVAAVPERFAGEIRTGQKVALSAEAYPGVAFNGTLTRINPTVDRASRSFTIEAAVPNEDRRLRAGSFVKASVLTHAADSALTVPEEAVVRFAGVVKVFVLDGAKARSAQVRTGEVVAAGGRRWVEVSGPLKAGDRVVVSGQLQLADGTPVVVRE